MKFKSISLIALLSLGLVACGGDQATTEKANDVAVEENVADTEQTTELVEETNTADQEATEDTDLASKEDEEVSESSNEASYDVNLAVLAGPTGAGAINMIDEAKNDQLAFNINPSVDGAPDAVVPKLVSGEADMAIIPANLASTLYNKTEGGISVLAINNLGVLYIVENGEPTITSLEDLVNSGKTIYASGKGATPEIAINQILTTSGLNPEDLNIEFLPEASEVAQKMIAGEAELALVPEPMATNILLKNENASVVLDVNQLYEESTESPLVSAVLVARDDYLENIDVDSFLDAYKASIDKANTDVDATAALLGEYEIMPEPVAKKALPNLALKYIDGEEMKDMLSTYLGSLFAANPEMVGGLVPEDDFYYQR